MIKVAIPMSSGHAALHFENSNQFLIYKISISNLKVISKQLSSDIIISPELIPQILFMHGVKFVFARRVSRKMAKMLSDNKIQLFAGVPEQQPDKLIEDFLEGELITDNSMCF
ncbi:MAG TPA: NifB/NifX family molybdenum-iron cluster-binding protein [Bacteroidales bacterium]|nr:NifB/NifX family molybdenum-iron cluster-binding protein [Bacteroidales bacterium]